MKVSDLRPLSIGEILDVAIKIYWNHALTLFKLVVVVVVPVQIVTTLVYASALPDELFRSAQTGVPPPGGDGGVPPDQVWTLRGANVAVLLLGFVSSVLANAACFKAVADAYLGAKPAWRPSLRFALRRLGSLLWVTVLYGLVFFIGLLFLLVPGIWIGVAWSVAIPALLAENVRGSKALGRSYGLVRHRWWPTFAIILVAILMTLVVQLIIGVLLGAVVLTDPGRSFFGLLIINGLANLIGSVLTTPFLAAVLAVVYFDLRVRKEGFDLELLARTVGVAPQEGARPLIGPRPSPPAGSQPPLSPSPPGRPPERPPS